MFLIRIPVWIAASLIRLFFIVVGWVLWPLLLLADGKNSTPRLYRWFGNAADVPASHNKNRWTKYVWLAWRNPVEGLDGLLTQPIPEELPNPDGIVRLTHKRSYSRWMEHGIFWEYWSLRKMSNGKYWEFRIGWKFVDGNEDFVPTFQIGPRK